ncbi:WXG100 family type VII secretion target [Halopolyspora algeriensis]|uniref:ESAT-6-like protein n=1 Tax=Halopolyspora algeriensis TaxID=1500506 RepID=A0A368VX07_9ACTN|nr:WXG100 family type VII secretion target [Halopolyspora algeriensis]RCW46736.1 WXG100 family type VII secretion target [Halopolyspora algeriensis]TQM46761.1 WXG100 family type VII secretion target [Halopolyspora algeriensis]
MSSFGTDADLMQKASGQVDEVRNNVEQAVNKLQSEIEPMIASWSGRAKETFQRLFMDFRENADTITSKLGELGENIGTSGREYAQRDEEQAAALGKIEGALGG